MKVWRILSIGYSVAGALLLALKDPSGWLCVVGAAVLMVLCDIHDAIKEQRSNLND